MRQCDSGMPMTAEKVCSCGPVAFQLGLPSQIEFPDCSCGPVAFQLGLPPDHLDMLVRGQRSPSPFHVPQHCISRCQANTDALENLRGILFLCRWDTTLHPGSPLDSCMSQGKTGNCHGTTERREGCPDYPGHCEGKSRHMPAHPSLRHLSIVNSGCQMCFD